MTNRDFWPWRLGDQEWLSFRTFFSETGSWNAFRNLFFDERSPHVMELPLPFTFEPLSKGDGLYSISKPNQHSTIPVQWHCTIVIERDTCCQRRATTTRVSVYIQDHIDCCLPRCSFCFYYCFWLLSCTLLLMTTLICIPTLLLLLVVATISWRD